MSVSELWHSLNTVVLQQQQRRCVSAKRLLLCLERPFRAALLLVYDPIWQCLFFVCFSLQAHPGEWRKNIRKVKMQCLHLRNAMPSKAFLQHLNSFVISACQTWLEQRIIAACVQAAQVKSISFDAARGLFFCLFPLLPPPASLPLWLDIALRLSWQPCNMTDLMTEER